MARPPRGRLPGSGRASDETDEHELPLELPRVDPIRSRIPRTPRVEPKLDPKLTSQSADDAPPRFVPPLHAAMPEPDAPPQKLVAERVDNPFDYYAMPKDESDPLSRPIAKSDAAGSSEFLTAKYFTPRSELKASRDFDVDDGDQTANWARSVRPGRPIFEPVSSQDDDMPEHLRNLPSRVRDHLRSEPKMPQVSEALGSFVQSAPTATQLRARSGVPLPLAPELRAPVPQSVRVTRQMPVMPVPPVEDERVVDPHPVDAVEDARSLEEQLEDAFHDNARDDFAHEAEFDSASDEAVTNFDPHHPPLVADLSEEEMARYALPDAAAIPREHGEDNAGHASQASQSDLPSWMRRTEQVQPPPPVSVSDWDQDQALHALTSRIRNRSIETASRIRNSQTEKLLKTARESFDMLRNKARDLHAAHASQRAEKRAAKAASRPANSAPDIVFDDEEQRMFQTDARADAPVQFAPDYSIADQHDFVERQKFLSFFKRKPRAPVVRVSVEANRAQRRKRQSRLYEDIVAWIVVPPFIIGAIYGGLELAKFLSNSPLGKMLSGQ